MIFIENFIENLVNFKLNLTPIEISSLIFKN